MFDLVISGGNVIDGTGAPRQRADVGIRQDRIVAVADDLSSADCSQRIDATGRIVAPGFQIGTNVVIAQVCVRNIVQL